MLVATLPSKVGGYWVVVWGNARFMFTTYEAAEEFYNKYKDKK